MRKATLINGTKVKIVQGTVVRGEKRLVQITRESDDGIQVLFDKTIPGYAESLSQYLGNEKYTINFNQALEKDEMIDKEEWIANLIRDYPHRFTAFFENASRIRYTIVDLTIQVIPVKRMMDFAWEFTKEMVGKQRLSVLSVLERRKLQEQIEAKIFVRDDSDSFKVPVKAMIERYFFD